MKVILLKPWINPESGKIHPAGKEIEFTNDHATMMIKKKLARTTGFVIENNLKTE